MEEKIITIALLAALLLACVIAYFFYVIGSQHKKIIEWQQVRVNAEINTLENERKSIAIDIHDDLGPLLSSVKMRVSTVSSIDETDNEIIRNSVEQMDDIIKKFRKISTNLLPNALLRNSLNDAVNDFIGRVSQSHIAIRFTSNVKELAEHENINIYRIIQEIIHNTLKHSQADLLSIDIHKDSEQIVIVTQDNGIGFTVTHDADVKTIGLLSIQSRVLLLNGTYTINSKIGNGTQYEIRIPLISQNPI